jgi:hypothetical protein
MVLNNEQIISDGLSAIGLEYLIYPNSDVPMYDGVNLDGIVGLFSNYQVRFTEAKFLNNLHNVLQRVNKIHQQHLGEQEFEETYDYRSKEYRVLKLALLGHKLHTYNQPTQSSILESRDQALSDITDESIALAQIVWGNKLKQKLYSLALSYLGEKPPKSFGDTDMENAIKIYKGLREAEFPQEIGEAMQKLLEAKDGYGFGLLFKAFQLYFSLKTQSNGECPTGFRKKEWSLEKLNSLNSLFSGSNIELLKLYPKILGSMGDSIDPDTRLGTAIYSSISRVNSKILIREQINGESNPHKL